MGGYGRTATAHAVMTSAGNVTRLATTLPLMVVSCWNHRFEL